MKEKIKEKLFEGVCPFCNGELSVLEHNWEDYTTWEFICHKCNISFFVDSVSNEVDILKMEE